MQETQIHRRRELPQWDRLFEAAIAARGQAHAPFSKMRVGASVVTSEAKLFLGANYESASFGLTMCAERAAILAAQGAGAVGQLEAIAIAAEDASGGFLAKDAWVTPCGACRQWLFEASQRAGRDLVVLCGSADFSRVWVSSARELLPGGFG